MSGNGFNPIYQECRDGFCWNQTYRPKIELLAECLPRKLAFMDIDAAAEVNGRFLFVEFKNGEARDIPTGQHLFFQRLTAASPNITVVVAACSDTRNLNIRAIRYIHGGKFGEWENADHATFKERVARWAKRSDEGERNAA